MESIVGFHLSPRQRHLWALLQDPGHRARDARALLRVAGPLDADALAAALEALVARHEILRTSFERLPGMPEALQVVEERGVRWEDAEDLRVLSGDAAEGRVEALWMEEPGDGDLPAARLLRIGDDEHRLLVRVHPLSVDEASWELLAADLAALYAAERGGTPVEDEPVPYLAVSEWLNEVNASDDAQAGRAFWLAQCRGPGEALPVEPDGVSGEPVAVHRVLPSSLASAVDALAASAGTSPDTVVLAAWAALLHRLGGPDAQRVGVASDGRADEELMTAIGPFTQHLPITATVDAATSFRALVEQLRDARDEAAGMQETFDAEAVHRLLAEGGAHDATLRFPLGFTPRPAGDAHAADGVSFSVARRRVAGEPFDLHLMMEGGTDGVALELRGVGFSAVRVARLLDRVEALLADAVGRPDAPLAAMAVMSAAERETVLRGWNATDRALPFVPVHVGVAAQAARTPDAVAVAFGGETMTYAELDRRANRLARHLRRLGVGVDARVGVCLDRSVDLVVALLGVLRAGGAYLPLDPAYPADRLAFMQADAGMPLLVTESRHLALFPDHAGGTVVLDRDRAAIDAEHDAAPGIDIHPEQLAYVIYTSGSTGRPKGVGVPHRALSNHMAWMQRAYPLTADDRVLQKTPLSFDASVWEFWAPMLAGATLAVGGAEAHRDPAELARAVDAHGVTILQLVPSLLRAVLDADALAGCGSLARLFCGGEALPAELAARAGTALGVQVVNLYGPTEVCIDSVVHTAAGDEMGGTVPIGRAVDNVRAYVLDGTGAPVPAGIAGELYLGGAQGARGYLGRPALTAERFVPDPFGPDAGARLYRTGDRVRHGEDGTLVFLGRADDQVKVRGMRIELGEVEAALLDHPAVRAAAAVVREDAPGDPRLVGYVVGDAAADEVRDHLRRILPEHMVPGAIVVLEALPLTPSGKVDRRALPAPSAVVEERYVAPRTPAEETLAAIWAELLRIDRVGVHDDFFDLGGHSLLATRLISRIREALRVELPLRTVFDHSTLESLAAAIEARMDGAGASVPSSVEGEVVHPATPAQRRLWLLDQLEPGNAAYHHAGALRLRGALDVTALERAVDEAVRRHETLRTRIETRDGEPVQVVSPSALAGLTVVDRPGLDDAGLSALVEEEAARPFDLARGPLFRVELVRMGDADHALLWTLHHAVADAASADLLIDQIGAAYAAFASGSPSPLAPLAMQFGAHAATERDRLAGAAGEEGVRWWREAMFDAPALLELPTDRPRPAVQSYRGGRTSVQLPAGLGARIDALAARAETTPFAVLLAALGVVLARGSGQDDVVIGTPVSGRAEETAGLVGPFAGALAIRNDLSGVPTFLALLGRIHASAEGAFAHADVPFEVLVDALQPERSLAHAPLFQVMLALANAPAAGPGFGDLAAEAVERADAVARVDLSLALTPRGGDLDGIATYAADLFDTETVDRMLGHLSRVLEQVTAEPDIRLSALDLLDDAERAQVLDLWNRTEHAYPADRTIHALFEAQAARTPDATAVAFEGERVSYRALNERANRLARALSSRGVGPEVRVGVCLERSVEMVVSLLGVLKAGGAYLPLDPGYPAERLSFMLADGGVSVLLTESALRDGLPVPVGVHVLDVRAAEADAAGESAENPESGATCQSLAYVIYTSGSTGRPKGVMNAHGGVVNRLTWMQAEYGIGAADVVLQKTPFSFDVSVWEFFWPLMTGATLVMARPDGHRDPQYLQEVIEREGVTTLHFVPSMLQPFVTAADPARCTSLRRVMCSGEALPPALVDAFHARFPESTTLHNLYGPTEAAVDVTYWPCERVASTASVPIGRPVWNTRMYVLDAGMRPAPIGIPGELYIGGVQVARGYLDRPELTAERFVPDPFAADAGMRLYRTGDRARWRADGALEYLGRLDAQVKVRGFRIELGEIEAAIRAHAGVRDCVAIVREDAPGEKRIAAYVVGDADAETLRTHLGRRLPEHMVPAAFIPLDALPLTPNGKLDRRALPAPDFAAAADAYVAPRTPAEEALAGIFAELLRVPRVGVHDNFFHLGGDSLLGTRVVAHVRDVLGTELPLRVLFEGPTVAALAAGMAGRAKGIGMEAPPVVPVPRDRPLPLSFAQQRLWIIQQLDPESVAYNVPYALNLAGGIDIARLERALSALADRHETLRTVFRAEDGGAPEQVILPSVDVRAAQHDLSHLSGAERDAEVRRRMRDEAERPFDLATGPLMRVTALKLAADEFALVFILHHVVTDGWSRDILVREVSELYAAELEGRAPVLPPLPVQYADWAVWQREWLAGPVLETQLAYWRARLAGAPSVLELPTDRPRTSVPGTRADLHSFALSAATSDGLRALARREGATLFMTLLAAWQVLLSRWSGQDDVVVGTPVAGRSQLEVENLIGFFVNTLAVRTDLSDDPPFRALVGRVREGVLDAHAHQDVPFEKLVDELQPERSLTHTPFFQTVFSLQTADQSALKLGGASASRAGGMAVFRKGGVEEAAKFDLMLPMSDGGGRIGGSLVYRTDLFLPETIARMVGQLERVLDQLAANPDLPVSALALMDDAERARVVERWNAVDTAYPADRTLHALFETRVAAAPDAPAVTFGEATLTYAELNVRANRIAHHLRGLSVGPEARVGLCLERGMEMVVAILAVLKAGGAYVPLDPTYPAERLAFMLADSGIGVLLTQDSLRDALPPADGVRVVSLDGDAVAIAAKSEANPEGGAGPESLAYVIYTSGSTGTPKGALVEHRNVARLFSATDAWFGFRADDVWTLFHSYAFDFSVWEMWGALLHGGRLVVVPFAISRDPEAFHALVRGEGVTMLSQTPSAFRQFMWVDADRGGELALRAVVFGGEALEPATLRDWVRRRGADHPRLVNMYGITETTVHVTYRPLTARDVFEGGGSPIGVRIPDLRLYVLNPSRRPMPVGVPGELYVGGAGVARGYLNRPELTAERFIDSPFVSGDRLYRTGDRVRWLADGTLEYLGRLDAQVKVRGFRIELGEIEAALLAHPAVHQCAVVVREDAPGDRRLAAYVVGEADGEALRAHLRRSLPEHMVPAAFVSIESIPLTPNGKLDARALPAPEHAAAADRYVAPRTAAEETLAAIWAEMLRLEHVGVEESFFELGGDSILAIQVVSRARRAGVDITPRQLFEHPTIAALAAVAARGGDGPARLAEQGRVEGSAPLTPVQGWFFAQGHATPSHHNQSVLLEVDAGVDDDVLARALDAVLDHHDALRLRFRRTADGWEQWHGETHGIALERVDLSALTADARDAAQGETAVERQAGLDLEAGPIGRAVLFDRGEGRRVLLLILHHLVVDGVSWRILREDLERAVAQLQAGGTVDVGTKSTSYRQWAEALRALAADPALSAEAEHWRAQGAEGVLPLPADGADRDDASGETAGAARTLSVRLDAEETRALLQEVPAVYRTQINDVLLCALADAVNGWTGGTRIRLSLEGHGRDETVAPGVDLTRTVGWFTSIHPVVLDTAGAIGPGDRLKRVKEQLRAVPRQGIGYGVLRYLGEGEMRDALAAQPEPEIAFNYLGQVDGGVAAESGLRFATGPRGRDQAAENRRPWRLEVGGGIAGGALHLAWTFDEGTFARETMERLATSYLAALRALIAHCREADAGGFTPSDFPLAALTQAQVEALTAGRAVEDLYPLSPLQEGLLFHGLYGTGSQEYQVQLAQRLEGGLDVDLLRRAWAEVTARHAILRTSFVWQGLPRPLQRVESAAEVPWTLEDWRHLSAAEQEAALERFLAADRARGFRLDEAPLMRLALLRVANEAWWIVWNQHHLLLDGWSTGRVVGEVFQRYAAGTAGREAEVRRSRPYRDYIAWVDRQDAAAAERHWREVLAGFSAPTPIPADRAADAGAGARPASLVRFVDPERTARLEAAARAYGVTLNTVLQGAWGLLLARWSGEDDVVFGTTVSGRQAELEGVEEMVGLFINTLPVRMRVPGGARLGAWLAGLQRAQAAAREFEYTPLVAVQGWSDVPRGAPLFESHFIFENYPVERSGGGGAGPGLRVTDSRSVEWTNYPLSLVAAPGGRLLLSLAYDEARFDPDTAERLMGHLERVLDQVAEGGDPLLSSLSLLDDAERARVTEWSAADAAYDSALCIHPLFEAQAARAPEAIAVALGDRSISYGELNAWANRLAYHLRRLGVGPDVRVGVCLERGMEMAITLLGVLKAGGAFVPLDAGHPAERLSFMLDDAGATVLVTQAALAGALPVPASVRVVDVDAARAEIAAESGENPAPAALPRSLAYVIYTSGSTGRPKGVAVEHGAAAAHLAAFARELEVDAADRMLHFASFGFDVAVEELFLPLIAGARVVLRGREMWSADEWPARMRAAGVTIANLSPAYWGEVAAAAHGAALPDLRLLIVGADAVPSATVGRWRDAVESPARLLNGYGPTEAVVTATSFAVPDAYPTENAGAVVPIGRPLVGRTSYVLDGRGEPVPAGVPGELYLGGVALARGYLNRSGLTARCFVPDPFAGVPGARLYRSGDRARWLADGTLEYLGRVDEQVKIRGFRIEPGEVESVLAAFPGVRQARVVVTMDDESGDRRLAAYVAGEVEVAELRAYLRGRLPDYMEPAAIVVMDQLPQTPNGKLDRAALPAPEPAVAGRYVAPRTPVEEVLTEIWAEVLRRDQVGVTDSFFELGGHSLLVIRVVSHIREIFGVELPLHTLFDAPTVAGMAALLTTDERYAESANRAAQLMQQVHEMSGEGAE